MERRQFLGNLSGPVLAACAVCMGACSKGGDSGTTPGTVVTPPANANITVNLNTSLLSVGSSVVQDGVIIVRLATGNTPSSFTAVQVACTHEGTSINFNSSSNQFVCPNHGSTFNTSGGVTLGPAAKALKQYTVNITGSTLTVTG
ncbi:MAG TPA: Rieske 2Fe-2S domain-containing protein [Sediminibacterium sp.]|jgi:cytochrome b6-f complex iron-sulfur subunit